MTPTGRTLAVLRELGYHAETVERWNPHSKTRHDLFGFIDVLGLHPEHGLLGIQATSSPVAARRAKIDALENVVRAWLRVARLEIWGWTRKPDEDGDYRWHVRRLVATSVRDWHDCGHETRGDLLLRILNPRTTSAAR